MKKWRVGTLSMGLSLISLGIVLFMSQWKGLESFDAFIAWWPLIFVLLGLEILVYLAVGRKESQVVSYDILSLFFVGVLCIGCLGMTLLTSVGVLGEVRAMIGSIDETKDLPTIQETVEDQVKKVIVQSGDQAVKVDKSVERTLNIFGTYRSRTQEGEAYPPLNREQFVTVQTIGDTMYVEIKRLPEKRGIDAYYPWLQATVVLPRDVQVEVRGRDNQTVS